MSKKINKRKAKIKSWFDNFVFSVSVGLFVSALILLGGTERDPSTLMALFLYSTVGLIINFISTIKGVKK